MKNLDDLENEQYSILKKISETDNDELLNERLDEFEKFAYSLAWDRIFIEHWIPEAIYAYDTLEYFDRIKDLKKSEYIAWVINHYYPNFLNEMISCEEYEKCSVLNKYLYVKDMPIL